MRQLNGLYTQRFNKRHQQVGHLLQGRYQAILVDKDNYLLELCRYIVLNPVRAGIVKDPRDWKWSAYRATIGDDQGIPGLTTDWILSQFGKEQKAASNRYQEFVRSGIKAESPLKAIKGQLFLGQYGYTLKDIAEYIGVHYTTVSRAIKRIEGEDEK